MGLIEAEIKLCLFSPPCERKQRAVAAAVKIVFWFSSSVVGASKHTEGPMLLRVGMRRPILLEILGQELNGGKRHECARSNPQLVCVCERNV